MLGLAGILSAAQVRPGSVTTAGGSRTYLLALPDGPARPGRPLVLLLHGHGGNARNSLGQGLGHASPLAAWLAIADREGVVVAALDGAKGPDGYPGWNDGRPGAVGDPSTDDLGFVRAVVDRAEKEQGVDPSRIYVMGMSNGAVMAQRLALDLDLPLAAVASACGSLPGEPPAKAVRPLSVLLIAGTEDPIMPYLGGQVTLFKRPRGQVAGVEATLAYWRKVDGLTGPPTVSDVPHLKGRQDPTRVEREVWGGPGGPQVELLKVVGGGHEEPSLRYDYGLVYRAVAGHQNRDLESAEAAWAFFKDKRATAR
ncbi:MAG TPA: PHB depolymerase family esterase [Holophagaceae bacterium]